MDLVGYNIIMAVQKRGGVWTGVALTVLLAVLFSFSLLVDPSQESLITGGSVVGILVLGNGSQCGDLNSGVTLTANIVANDTCFVVNVSNIIIDGAGFTITGNGTGSGVQIIGFNNITVRNIIITNFTSGIQVLNSAQNTFWNTTIRTTNVTVGKHAIEMINVNLSNISSNTLVTYANSSAGVSMSSSSNNNTIMFNIINASGTFGDGVDIGNSLYAEIIQNNITTFSLAGRGVYLISTNHSRIHLNIINKAGLNASGIYLSSSSHNYVDFNNITTLQSSGIFLDDSADGTSSSNNLLVNNNISSGIYFEIQENVAANSFNNLIYNDSTGEINWSRNITTNVSLLSGMTIFLQQNLLGLADSADALNLNGTATIEIRNLAYTSTPSLLKSGYRCDHTSVCNISYNSGSGILSATISSFSNYTTQVRTAPNVSAVTPSLNSVFNTSQIIEIGVNVTDDSGIIDGVVANVTYPNGTIEQLTLLNSTGHPQRFNFSYTIPRLNGLYNVTFYVNDSANNVNSTAQTNFTALLTCGEIRHSVLMDQNLTASGTCFTINRSNIALDCQGYSINYSNSGAVGNAVNNTGFDNVTVRHCIIREGNESGSSKHGILFDTNALNGTIYNNSIRMIGALSEGVALREFTNRTNVTQNTITSSGANSLGINLFNAHQNRAYLNLMTISGTSAVGISVNGSSANEFTANNITVTGSGRGIDLLAGTPSLARHNVFMNTTIFAVSGFTILDLSAGTDNNTLWYNGTFGTINWTSGNLTTNSSLIVGTTIFIDNNILGVANSPHLLELNRTARLVMRELGYSSAPQLLKAGNRCDDTIFCNVSYNITSGILDANVSGFSNYTTQATPPSSSSGGGSSSSTGSSGGTGSRQPQCLANNDCAQDEYCLDNRCHSYECLTNSDCRNNYYCVNHFCSVVFDLKILDIGFQEGEIDFTYSMKNMVQDEGDATMHFTMLNSEGAVVSSGSDVIFVGSEEVVEDGKLFFSSLSPGEYTLQVKLTYKKYEVMSYRTFPISAQEAVVVVPVDETQQQNLFGQAIGLSSLFGYIRRYVWLMLVLISVIIVSGIIIKKTKPRKNEMDLLGGWVLKALLQKESKEDIHRLLQQHHWPELKIHIALERAELVQQLRLKYNLSESDIETTRKMVQRSFARSKTKEEVMQLLLQQGWDEKTTQQFVMAYYIRP